MTNDTAIITFYSDYVEGDFLNLTIARAGFRPTLLNTDFIWKDVPNISSDPYEIQVAPTAGMVGSETATQFEDKLNLANLPYDIFVTRVDNVVTIKIITRGYTFVSGSSTDADIDLSSGVDVIGGDLAVITFTSEGIDTTELTMTIITDGIGAGPLLIYDWTATPTVPYDVQVSPTAGLVGSVTAQNFANEFNATQNVSLDYIVIVVDNVVTIQSDNPNLTIDWEITNTAGTADVGLADTSLLVNAEIVGQEITDISTYCYLYEPLRVSIFDVSLLSDEIFIDLEIVKTSDDTVVVEYLEKYAAYDINPNRSISVDLMKIVRQYHDSNIFNYSHIDEIVENTIGWNSVVSEYKYNFYIRTGNEVVTPIVIKKLPIVGGRSFEDFTPIVDETTSLNEFDYLGIDVTNKWKDFPIVTSVLNDASLQNASPSIDKVVQTTEGERPCAGFVLWKSRRGGWMFWGFDIISTGKKHKYKGDLAVDLFEVTNSGLPYIPVDYTSTETSYSYSLKSLSLSSLELEAVSEMNATTAVYFMRSDSGKLELMRADSISAPLSNQARGGDFSISLSSISTSRQLTR